MQITHTSVLHELDERAPATESHHLTFPAPPSSSVLLHGVGGWVGRGQCFILAAVGVSRHCCKHAWRFWILVRKFEIGKREQGTEITEGHTFRSRLEQMNLAKIRRLMWLGEGGSRWFGEVGWHWQQGWWRRQRRRRRGNCSEIFLLRFPIVDLPAASPPTTCTRGTRASRLRARARPPWLGGRWGWPQRQPAAPPRWAPESSARTHPATRMAHTSSSDPRRSPAPERPRWVRRVAATTPSHL